MYLYLFFCLTCFAAEDLESQNFEETDFYEGFAPQIFYSHNSQSAYVSSYEQPFTVDENSYFTDFEYSEYGEPEAEDEYFAPNLNAQDSQVLFRTLLLLHAPSS